MMGKHFIALFALFAIVACSSSDGTTSSVATTGTDGLDSASASTMTDGLDGQDGTSSTDGEGNNNGSTTQKCLANTRAYGYAKTELGDIVFQNNPLTVQVGHAAGKSCANEISMKFSIEGGCALEITTNTAGGVWNLVSGTLNGNSSCGAFWAADDSETFTLLPSESRFGLRNVPDTVASADGECGRIADDTPLLLTGSLRFSAPGAGTDGQDREIVVNVNDLGIRGQFLASETTSAECPSEPRLCQGIECGIDYFGANCGGCDTAGLSCIGGACVEGGCQPTSTKTGVGDAIGDQKYTDMNGELFTLHSLCEAPAVYMLQVTHWCSACSYRAPSFKALYDQYAPKGAKFILLVGQNTDGTPSGPADAASYKAKLGYQDGWIVLADPDFIKTHSIMTPTSNGIPRIQILDRDLVMRYSTTSTDFGGADQTALIQIMTQAGAL